MTDFILPVMSERSLANSEEEGKERKILKK